MANLTRRSRSFARAPKQRTIWENLSFDYEHSAAPSKVIGDLSPEPLGLLNIGTAKLHRVIGRWTVFSKGDAVVFADRVFLGMTVATRDAFDAGALPDSESDFQQSWYYWTKMNSIGNIVENGRLEEGSFDIRTSRIIRSGFVFALTTDNPTNGNIVRVSISLRLLWTVY